MQPTQLYSPTPASHLGNRIIIFILIAIALYCFSETAVAADIHTVLRNLRRIINPFTALLCVISFVAGVIFIFKALIKIKRAGTIGQQSLQPGELLTPIVAFIVGAVLLYIPTSTEVLTNSLFDTGRSIFGSGSTIDYSQVGTGASLLGYGSSGSLAVQWADLANTLVLYIQFFGFFSFVRGWFLVAKAGSQGGGQGSVTKGVVHIIGGIIAINIIDAFHIVRNTIFYG